jgi:hypothetical protein
MGADGTDLQDGVTITVQRVGLSEMLGHFDIRSLTVHAL